LRAWVRRAKVDSGEDRSGALMTAEREDLARLCKQVKILEIERAIPKKSTALFAKGASEIPLCRSEVGPLPRSFAVSLPLRFEIG
jgi:transposase